MSFQSQTRRGSLGAQKLSVVCFILNEESMAPIGFLILEIDLR